jgi:hypothetical protein
MRGVDDVIVVGLVDELTIVLELTVLHRLAAGNELEILLFGGLEDGSSHSCS